LISVDTSTGKVNASALISNEAILNSMFRIYQTIVEQSQIYDDHYSGIPINLQDDLNELRTIIREMKGTVAYTDPVPGTLGDFDKDVTALHGNGVLKNVLNEFVYTQPTPATMTIDTGKAIINGYVPRTAAIENPIFTNPISPTVNDEIKQFTGGVLNLNRMPINIASVIVKMSIGGPVVSPSLYHVSNSSTGEITSDGLGDGTNFYFTYSYNQKRYDIVQIDNNSVISVKQGIQFDFTSTGIVPVVDTNNLKLYDVLVQGGATPILTIIDKRVFITSPVVINQDITGIIDLSIYFGDLVIISNPSSNIIITFLGCLVSGRILTVINRASTYTITLGSVPAVINGSCTAAFISTGLAFYNIGTNTIFDAEKITRQFSFFYIN
jgi:hypothetical protein